MVVWVVYGYEMRLGDSLKTIVDQLVHCRGYQRSGNVNRRSASRMEKTLLEASPRNPVAVNLLDRSAARRAT